MKKEPPNQPAADAPSDGAGAPRRAHAINSIALELNAATAIRSYDNGSWAAVFAIHNLYRGKNHAAKGVPISVKFSGNTVAYALTAIKRGTHFTVVGSLDHDAGDRGKEFYRINAEQLRVHSVRTEEPESRS